MPNYQNGKIYCIRSHQTERVYIGSTTQRLSKRMVGHRSNSCSSRDILQYDDAYIELIENYPCIDVSELQMREGHFIRTTDCVNKNIAGRTDSEWYQDNKVTLQQAYQDNKPAKIAYEKQAYQNNKPAKIAYSKQAYENNKPAKLVYAKQAYLNNKSMITCICGVRFDNGNNTNRKKHLNSQRHQAHS